MHCTRRQSRVALSPCPMKCLAELPPLPLRFSTTLQSLRPRPEQSPKRSSWRIRCATFPQSCVVASQGRSSARRRCDRTLMLGRPSLGVLFRPIALRAPSVPPRGCPCDWVRNRGPARPLPLRWPNPPRSLMLGSTEFQGPPTPLPPGSQPRPPPPATHLPLPPLAPTIPPPPPSPLPPLSRPAPYSLIPREAGRPPLTSSSS